MPDGLALRSWSRSDASFDKEEDRMHEESASARLEVVEALLSQAVSDAADAADARREVGFQRARAAEFVEALAKSQQIIEELHRGFASQTAEFEYFVERVRAAAAHGVPDAASHRALHDVLATLEEAALRSTEEECARQQELRDRERRETQSRVQRGRVRHYEAAAEALEESLSHEKELSRHLRASLEESEQRLGPLSLSLEESDAARGLLLPQLARSEASSAETEILASEAEARAASSEARASRFSMEADASAAALVSLREELLEANASSLCTSRTELAEARTGLQHCEEAQVAAQAERILQIRERALADQITLPSEVFAAVRVLVRGATLKKYSVRRKRWQLRFLGMSPSDPGTLRWSPNAQQCNFGRRGSQLRLNDVIALDLGGIVAGRLGQSEKPWCCFALWTITRPYFFWSGEEQLTETLVVAISNMCPMASTLSRRDVRLQRAYCKLGLAPHPRRPSLLRTTWDRMQKSRRASPRRARQETGPGSEEGKSAKVRTALKPPAVASAKVVTAPPKTVVQFSSVVEQSGTPVHGSDDVLAAQMEGGLLERQYSAVSTASGATLPRPTSGVGIRGTLADSGDLDGIGAHGSERGSAEVCASHHDEHQPLLGGE